MSKLQRELSIFSVEDILTISGILFVAAVMLLSLVGGIIGFIVSGVPFSTDHMFLRILTVAISFAPLVLFWVGLAWAYQEEE